MIPLSYLLKYSLLLPLLFYSADSVTDIPHTPNMHITAHWNSISDGISCKLHSTGKSAPNILITFGGFLQPEESVKRWSDALFLQKGEQLNIALQIVVKGPLNDYYQNRELELIKLISFIDSLIEDKKFKNSEIFVVGYSSGVFVFHELLNILNQFTNSGNTKYKGKITYFSLDGAMGKNQGIFLTQENTVYLKKIYGVYAENTLTGTKSARSSDVIDLVKHYKNISELIVVNSDNSGCLKGAKWCVHESLIVKAPPFKSGLSGLYNYDFGEKGENVTFEYLNNLTVTGEK